MNKLLTGVLAFGLAASLAACSGTTTSAPTPTGAGASESSATTAPQATSPDPAPGGTTDQSTPEAVMTAWLNALVDGKTADICALTAVDGKIASDVGGNAQCTKSLGSLAGSLKSASSLFEGLTIKGATVKGNKATFETATTKPELAAQLIKALAAVKIGSKWYVTTP
ncbi:MAG: hypothetical protein ABI112_17185 [Terracoccus sp.]